jgi:NAD kinase
MNLIPHRYLQTHHPHLHLLAETHTLADHSDLHSAKLNELGEGDLDKVEMVVTLGGDGTVLHTSNLFGVGECPPVVSFSMGSLGFLLPFRESGFYLRVATAEQREISRKFRSSAFRGWDAFELLNVYGRKS